ncbi:hypothetical protein [Williamwhitmania taraxaci]|uniref:Uncharacterized protein n=1 Tax=Williamwhitmania taraxaci TaxID=1640674 RepID=A0A1G6R525_9BACT|nr:hypothetical protein [Williamwhitmania taraxaci]SDC99016.1 hypothetical protein SAMN05216323_106911 [Williamwhitmania taraxaci]
MPPSIQQEQIEKLGNWVAPRLNKLEIILAAAFTIGLLMKVTATPKSSLVILLSLSILPILYFLNAFAVPENKETSSMEVFIGKLIHIAAAIACIGILFTLQNWKGSNISLKLGSITLIISFLATLILKSWKPELRTFNQRLLLRALVIGVVGLSLHLTPKEKLIDLGVIKKVNTEQTSNNK